MNVTRFEPWSLFDLPDPIPARRLRSAGGEAPAAWSPAVDILEERDT